MKSDYRRQPVEDKAKIAIHAINILGGALAASKKIEAATGVPITRHRVQKWKDNGISPGFHPIVHQLTGIPITELDSDIYPEFLWL